MLYACLALGFLLLIALSILGVVVGGLATLLGYGALLLEPVYALWHFINEKLMGRKLEERRPSAEYSLEQSKEVK